jgi:hypothetical protein
MVDRRRDGIAVNKPVGERTGRSTLEADYKNEEAT